MIINNVEIPDADAVDALRKLGYEVNAPKPIHFYSDKSKNYSGYLRAEIWVCCDNYSCRIPAYSAPSVFAYEQDFITEELVKAYHALYQDVEADYQNLRRSKSYEAVVSALAKTKWRPE